MSDLSYAVRYPGQCHEEVSRQHEAQPCDKTAVAVRQNIDGGEPYPVCAFHARGDGMVPLSDLIEAGRAAFAADLREQGARTLNDYAAECRKAADRWYHNPVIRALARMGSGSDV